MAEVMRATAMRTMPSAIASTERPPPTRAARPATASRARAASSAMLPPSRRAPPMRPSTMFASVTVGSVPPQAVRGGPG